MFKDKSRILLLGALVLLVMVLMDGGSHFHGFGLFHGLSWLRWVLLGVLIWLIVSRCGCCGSSASHDEAEEEIIEEEDEAVSDEE